MGGFGSIAVTDVTARVQVANTRRVIPVGMRMVCVGCYVTLKAYPGGSEPGVNF